MDWQMDGWMDKRIDWQMDRQTDRWMEIWMEDRHLEIPPCVVQEIGPLGPLSKKLEKDNSVNNIEVLRLLRTVGMDGWGWMDIDGPVCGWRGPIWSRKGLRGQIYSLSQLIWDLGRLTRLVRADLSPAGADLRFGRALKVTKSCRIQELVGGQMGWIWGLIGPDLGLAWAKFKPERLNWGHEVSKVSDNQQYKMPQN